MEPRTPCEVCGGLNRRGASFCGRCYRRLVDAPRPSAPPVAVAAAARPSYRGDPYAGSRPVASPTDHQGWAFPLNDGGANGNGAYHGAAGQGPSVRNGASYIPLDRWAFEAALSEGTLARGTFSKQSNREPVKWRWPHLALIGSLAWALPQILSRLLSKSLPAGRFLDAALIFQILGYLLAAGAVTLLVKRVQGGDWSSIGLRLSEARYNELGRGAIFGTILVVGWLPVALVLTKLIGTPMFDQLVRSLVGDTSPGGLVLAGIVVVAGAPLIEEMYYRGVLFNKIARLNINAAVVATSLLFVMAHGALIIPPLLLLAFALGYKRRTESLWYTIGAHAAWNLVITCLAVFLLLGPGKIFEAPDGSYTIRHPSNWQRVTRLETSLPGATIDMALEGPGGSMVMAARFALPDAQHDYVVAQLLLSLQNGKGAQVHKGLPVKSQMFVPDSELVFEATGTFTENVSGTNGTSRLVAVVPSGESEAVVLNLVCPDRACVEASRDFDKMIRSIDL